MRSALAAGAGALLFAAIGCGPVVGGGHVARPTIPAPVPIAVTTADVTAMAEILQAEDQRDPNPTAVVDRLSAGSSVVRARAAIALGALGAPGGIDPLIPLLADADTAVAASAAFALGQARDTAAVSALSSLLGPDLHRERVTVSSEAAYALGKIRSETARAALRDYLAAASPEAVWQAPVTESALLAIWRFPRDGRTEPIARWAAAADPEIRWRAVYALVRRPDPASVPVLRDALDDGDPRVRALAVRGLTAPLADSAGAPVTEVLPALLEAIEDGAYIVRVNAIGALGTYRHPDAVTALVDRLSGDSGHEVFVAAEALGRLGAAAREAAPRLETLAGDDRAPVALRAAALDALGRVSSSDARRVAVALSGDAMWRLRAAAARVLAGSHAAEADRLLRDTDGRVASAALQAAIGAAGDSLQLIRPLLVESVRAKDIGVRTAALGALRELADPATLPLVLDAYGAASEDPWNDAALAAIEAVAALQSGTLDPSRAFFARFADGPDDPVVHRAALGRFGERAVDAWGPATPIATGMTRGDYERAIRRMVVPELQQRRAATAVVTTESGVIELRLHGSAAPLTVRSFAALANAGFFDGQEWPRVVPNFVVQGGDPRGDTSGGPGYVIRDEIGRHRYGTGTLGMALSGPDTGGSQFFVTHSPQPHLDGIYAVFGEVVSGRAVTERILPGERIISIRVEAGT